MCSLNPQQRHQLGRRHPHLTGGETEAQRLSCPRAVSGKGQSWDLNPGSLVRAHTRGSDALQGWSLSPAAPEGHSHCGCIHALQTPALQHLALCGLGRFPHPLSFSFLVPCGSQGGLQGSTQQAIGTTSTSEEAESDCASRPEAL